MLTKRQKQILDFITKYIKRYGVSPSLEETKRHFRLSSVATVHQHIEALKNKGYLNKINNQPRGIEVKESNKLIQIPLLGTIAAGQPIEAIESSDQTVSISEKEISPDKNHYALRVEGDSMINEGIFDGDIVVVREQETADNGQTIVAVIDDNKATLKKIYKENNRVRLQPANQTMLPIYRTEVEIRGVVVKIIRNLDRPNNKLDENEFTKDTIKYIEETDINYRKSLGQYFTPKSIREALLNELPKDIKNPKILDPACGTGEFLITALEYFKKPELYGWDIDKRLIDISRKTAPQANLKITDSLLNKEFGKFDFVIGNPPYFEFSPPKEVRREFGEIINGRVNIFSLFIYRGLQWLKEGGYLAYIVPPSMNNGAYFQSLRKFIVNNSNIEYIRLLKDPKLFNGALQSTMLLVLRKGKNKEDYIFRKNGILIFSESASYLKKTFRDKVTLHDLNYVVKTGRLVWNQHKKHLTNNPEGNVPLIWAHNIGEGKLKFPVNRKDKPQYVNIRDYDIGPAIVVNRITGSINSAKIRAAVIPAGKKFIAENHVNVIFPDNRKLGMQFEPINDKQLRPSLSNITKQLLSNEKRQVIQGITGNTQISKNELEKLFPISIIQ